MANVDNTHLIWCLVKIKISYKKYFKGSSSECEWIFAIKICDGWKRKINESSLNGLNYKYVYMSTRDCCNASCNFKPNNTPFKSNKPPTKLITPILLYFFANKNIMWNVIKGLKFENGERYERGMKIFIILHVIEIRVLVDLYFPRQTP